jgi:phospholipid/cholesterol/gamma-HCH transport system permease protein
MAIERIDFIARPVARFLAAFGDFAVFAAQTFRWMITGALQLKNLRLLLPQMYEVGVSSVPVVAITGGFIGMVMAVESFNSFKAIGQEMRMGSIINLSVVAGRVGGALTAELGTMNVTEQLDAMRVMGTDPIRYLVVPRFLACVLLTPVLTIYSDLLGVTGGWLVSVYQLKIPNAPYWQFATAGVETWQIVEGIFKAIFFGAAIGLIACYKGFTSGGGASGVGRACTESFVASFIAIIILNFFFANMLQSLYVALYGVHGVFD